MRLRGVMLAFLLAQGPCAPGQGILEGRVTDSLGNPLVAVSVLVWALPDSTQAGYGYTAGDGRFSVGVEQAGYYLIRFQGLSYHPDQQVVAVKAGAANTRYRLEVVLREKPIALAEVIVHAEKAMRVGRDTVELRVDAFMGGGERVAEDVLKRLPGVQVGADGGIRVRGKPVSKVLIEGDDLFDQRYAMLTRNLDASLIDRVEILSRYVENPLLKNVHDSEAVALNIRLKEEVRNTLFGRAELGAGRPAVYEGKLNLINVRKGTKAYFLGDLNNAGNDVSGELQGPVQWGRAEEASYPGDSETLDSYLGGVPPLPGLSGPRSHFNNAELASLSGVLNPTQALKVKAHAFFSGDERDYVRKTLEAFRTDSLSFRTLERSSLRRDLRAGQCQVSFVYKTGGQQLEWVSRAGWRQQGNRERLAFSGLPLRETTYEAGRELDNRLTFTRQWDSASALQLTLRHRLERKPLYTRVHPFPGDSLFAEVGPTAGLGQQVGNRYDFRGLQARWFGKKGPWTWRLHAGFSRRLSILENQLFAADPDPVPISDPAFQNRARSRLERISTGGRLSLKFRGVTLRGGVSLLSLANRFESQSPMLARALALEPSLGISWQPDRRNHLLASYSYAVRETGMPQWHQAYLLTGYRNFERGGGWLSPYRIHRWVFGHTYGDWGDAFQMRTSLLYQQDPQYLGADSHIGPGLQFAGLAEFGGRDWLSFDFQADRYLKTLAANLKFRLEYRQGQYENRINGQLRPIASGDLRVGPEWRTVFGGAFNAHAGFLWQLMRTTSEFREQNHAQTGFLDLEVRPGPKWFLELSSEYFAQGPKGAQGRYLFTDFTARFTPAAGGPAFRLQLTNLWNTTAFRNRTLTDTGYLESAALLRPRFVMLSVDFRL